MRTCNCEQAQELRKRISEQDAHIGTMLGYHVEDKKRLDDLKSLLKRMLPQVGVHSKLATECRELIGLES